MLHSDDASATTNNDVVNLMKQAKILFWKREGERKRERKMRRERERGGRKKERRQSIRAG